MASTGTRNDAAPVELVRLEELHRLVRIEQLRFTQGALVFACWAGGLLLELVGFGLVMQTPSWRSFSASGLTLDLPAAPRHTESPGGVAETAARGPFVAGFERLELAADALERLDLEAMKQRMLASTPGSTALEVAHEPWQGRDALWSLNRSADGEVRELTFKADRALYRVFARCDGRYRAWADRVLTSVQSVRESTDSLGSARARRSTEVGIAT